MENNRRKSERVNVSLEVTMESSSGKRGVRISDLSEGGCFVDSISVVNLHEKLSLKVRMPTGELIGLYGEVVTVFPGIGFGLRFIPESEEERTEIDHLVSTYGGKLSQSSTPKVEKDNAAQTENQPFSEFEQFIEDVLGKTDDTKKS